MTRVTLLILAAQLLMCIGIEQEPMQWWLVAAAFGTFWVAVVHMVRLFPSNERPTLLIGHEEVRRRLAK